MLDYPLVEAMMEEFGFVAYQRDACADGAPWRKPLLIITPSNTVGRAVTSVCRGGHPHLTLRGPSPQGIP